ncbi:TrmH family RNA methyltransferase [Pseudonocardia spinosispora]|uniref:TrmH family RNA methyltransferase n=1 Tax=Pseudonocardia spinosispora TaxID=103441 RepID=UPI0004118F51|nr:RNA methyltransferase [Pseudonocardia spinosispora]
MTQANEVITSAANPLVKRIRSLADRKHRRREGAFVVEGVQPVWRAVEAGWTVETLVVASELLPDSAADMVTAQRARGVRVAEVSAELAGRLTERDRSPGLFAVVRIRTTASDSLDVPADGVFVALHDVANPGNLGTIIRTADAAGAAGVLLVGDTADQFAPSAVKASMGSLFAVPVVRLPDLPTFFGWARDRSVSVVATSGYAEREYWSGEQSTPSAILLGSEGDGLPDVALEGADRVVRIPMVGTAESLNLAVAAGLMLYEARRHRIGSPDSRGTAE